MHELLIIGEGFANLRMILTGAQLLKNLSQGKVPLVCIADGEESYDIDRITKAYENLLPEAERDFNLLVHFGKETTVTDVLSTCRRFPMFADYQVVILRDAAALNGLADMASYLENPAPNTRLLIEHRFKKLDGRNKMATLAKNAEGVAYVTSQKLKESDVPSWIMAFGHNTGFQIGLEEAQVLTSMLGTDLHKIENEIGKIRINVPNQKHLTHDLIRRYIGGGGREYNLFEFPETFVRAQAERRYQMLAHFIANQKAAPLVLVLSAFYSHFSRLYNAAFVDPRAPDADKLIGTWKNKLRPTIDMANAIGRERLEEIMLLTAETSAQAVGMGTYASPPEILKEYVARLEWILGL